MSEPIKFLLVDDQEPNLLALQGILKRDGLQLLKAGSGAEALELLLVHQVDLALLDVQMPEMDGFELAELMRGTERTRRVPIIFITAGATNDLRRFRGYELGAVDFLLKPIDAHILKSKAEVFFDLARAREHLEKTVRDRTAELRATNAQLETFVYSIAHDLRAPLRAMTAYSHLLLDEHAAALNAKGQRMLQRIQASSEFMDKLLLDLLAFSRASRGEIKLGPVEVAAAWNIARQQCVEQIEHTQAQVEAAEPLSRVVAHEPTLGQCFANLLGNSLKFLRPGVAPKIRLWSEPRGAMRRLYVDDNGLGIPADQGERIFRVFERLEGDRFPGTGIGLAIVRAGVERMGGKVGIESKQSEGTRFWIDLPAAN